ncbi:MAG: polar amino acid transport system substrate-binding protein [Mycobacterium sp.]|nr:polar amino acid transport system substrate-binding protein [Mycobacterium sp.]
MRARVVPALTALVLAAAGCGSPSTPPSSVAVAPIEALPSGAQEATAAPVAESADCGDREASLRPGPQPRPGNMPPGSTMATIAERGRLIVGVDQNTRPFGFRDPSTGQLEGFDIDVAREIARAIFGDPNRIDPRVVEARHREDALKSGEVDVVVRTYSITCDRKEIVAFSTTYFNANQKILAVKGSGIDSAAALAGKRVCAATGTTSLKALLALESKPKVFGVTSWTDCLVMLQQGQVDAISTDDAVLAGLKEQDPNVEVVGDSIAVEPYGIGIKKENEDLVRFVNGVLDEMRADGTWNDLYDKDLLALGPSPGPPMPRYQD